MYPHEQIDKIVGPWPCEQCGHLSQFATVEKEVNTIFCKNENCRFVRKVDKRHNIIVENDGSVWKYDPHTSAKIRIHAR